MTLISNMRTGASALAALVVLTVAAEAREPGTPTLVPPGNTVAVPAGANPPPGLYFSSRTEIFRGDYHDGNGNKTAPAFDLNATALQFHFVPGIEILGGTYRAMVLFPLFDNSAEGVSAGGSGLGDIFLSPLNVSWQLSPGLFVQTGLSFGLPTGSFSADGSEVSLGANVLTTSVDIGFSYLRDGWNASAHMFYFRSGRNDDTDYRSGDEILLNLTAMKEFGDFSLGAVGYWREQVTDDRNYGNAYGGAVAGRAQQVAVGLGFSRKLGPGEMNVNILHDVKARNTLGGDALQLNYTMPLFVR